MLLGWRGSKSLTERDQPDTRQNVYAEEIEGSGEFIWQDLSSSGTHDYYYLTEDVADVGVDLAIPFNPFEIDDPTHDPLALAPGQYVKLGAAVLRRDRDFDTRRFRYVPSSIAGVPVDEDGDPIDFTESAEDLFAPENINPLGFVIDEVTRPTDNYEAEQDLDAAYISASFRVHPQVRLAGGARVESSTQTVRTFELFGNPPQETIAELDDTDVLPALNVTWEFVKDHQLRLGASRTVSRPEFRELAEFEYTDIEGGYAVRGNPNLERALLTNLDLRWEWYPTTEELVSISLFGKEIDQPIEQVNLPTGSALITSFDNAESAEIYGIELEGRKGLGFIDPGLDPWNLRGNVAWIESEVKASENPLALQTNDERPLQGAPEWTANLGIFFTVPERGFDAGILANAFGERISAVGSGGTPDEYEQTRVQLDCTISKSFENGSSMRISFENILNSEYLYEVGGETSRSYKTGFSVGISYSVEL
jgi:TonB-dependent receptor